MNRRRLSFGEKVKGFLGAPANTFTNVEPETLGSALKYFAIWAAIYAILQTVVFYTVDRGVFQTLADLLGLSAAFVVYRFDAVAFGLMNLLGAFAGLFISGSWAHLFVRAFGGRKGYGNTMKAFAYGNTPVFLFGWIPFAGTLSWIWAAVLDIIGIRQLHEVSTGRAVGAVLLSYLALIIIAVLIVVAVVLFIVLAGP